MKIRGLSIEAYLEKVRAFHGHLAPGMVCGGFMVELAFQSLPEGGLYDAIAETRACLPDAIQVLTPCTIGNGWLRIEDTGRFAILLYDKHTGKGVRVALDPERLKKWPEVHVWAMKLKPKKEQDKKRLFSEIIEAGFGLYKVERIVVDRKRFPRKGRIFTCPDCGESFRGSESGSCEACMGRMAFSPLREERSGMRALPVEEAAGLKVLHDMTRIEPGVSKGAVIVKGQSLGESDIQLLKSMGRERVYVEETGVEETGVEEKRLENSADALFHENEVALAFAEKMAGSGITYLPFPREGKIDFTAKQGGIFRVDRERLMRFNRCEGVMCATRRNVSPVSSGMVVGGTRAIPLFLEKRAFNRAMEVLAEGPLFSLAPYVFSRLGVLVTGTEVFEGRVRDGFLPILEDLAAEYGLKVTESRICPDDAKKIAKAALEMVEGGVQVLVVTGGLSVDPDDVTRKALQDAGLVDEVYGAPVLPGAMTLTGRIASTSILGVPAGALYSAPTAMDFLLPMLLADLPITRADMASLGEGGFLDAGRRMLEGKQ
ncbi:formylmethanofuran dehydrogenase subunit E [Desulfobotulus alkaliphilus]|uniref:Formylmethanofuran dehydrogenase subunit E n=1 Tax=Desulfobotulus alkaliphilus TaxID=622671 RepID=A0A562RPM2_9BACT|nr:FmdE family protein [Desulfobotulus alkaliphilus]TWI70336.1 formylmethanofuran dehydrogenase subunit E [Desulfobotulus alkaliphilus]